jgi:uncharacterized protein (TIGR03067 family)
MLRITSLLLGAVALALLVGNTDGGEAKKKSKLEGTWKPVSVIKNGKDEPDKKDHSLTFAGDTFTIKEGDKVEIQGTFKTDKSKKPREIDMTVNEGPEKIKGKVLKGIYEQKGDTLRWCFTIDVDGARPAAFEAPEGSTLMFITLKREKK